MEKEEKSKWKTVIWVLLSLLIAAYVLSSLISVMLGEVEQYGNVAVIPIKGIILTGSSDGVFSSTIADSSDIVGYIEEASETPGIAAIILEIDSPGGAPVASDEIATALQKSNKTSVALIREIGTSGAYWLASATDHIVANRMSLTGSIGVIGSYLDFSGFINDWNISYERLVGGKYKDAGTPLRSLSDDERAMFQKKIDLLHQEFKDIVMKNRKMSQSQINNIAEGEFYLGSEAKGLGLIDEIGGKDEAIRYIEENLNITAKTVRYEHKPGLIEVLSGIINQRSYYIGKGMADANIGMVR